MMKFAKRLKKIRQYKGYTQLDVAAEIGVEQSTIAKWESGKTEPKASSLIALSKLFQCSVDLILGIK